MDKISSYSEKKKSTNKKNHSKHEDLLLNMELIEEDDEEDTDADEAEAEYLDELKPVKQYFIDSLEKFPFVNYDPLAKKKKTEVNEYERYTEKMNNLRNRKYNSVFDRLTDTNFYTGIHKERFDDLGNGKGLVRSNETVFCDGYNESCLKNLDSYSSIIKKNKHPVVKPGTLGIQKYGIQMAAPKYIWIFRNGDKYHNGILFLVKTHINNWATLLCEITKVLSPNIGPVRKMYDQNFRVVKSLNQLVDGAKYLCTSGEPPASLDKLQIFLSKWVKQK